MAVWPYMYERITGEFWQTGHYIIQSLQLGPDFRTLVRIRTFLTKLVRIWSGFLSKVRIFQKNYKITHENGFFWHGNGFFWHVLCESVMVNLTVKVRESLDSCTESGFLKEMVWIWFFIFQKKWSEFSLDFIF